MIYFTADKVEVDVNDFSPVSIKRILDQVKQADKGV